MQKYKKRSEIKFETCTFIANLFPAPHVLPFCQYVTSPLVNRINIHVFGECKGYTMKKGAALDLRRPPPSFLFNI